jgi:5-methyltetrahydrofolate--homocysteine methyltransferase
MTAIVTTILSRAVFQRRHGRLGHPNRLNNTEEVGKLLEKQQQEVQQEVAITTSVAAEMRSNITHDGDVIPAPDFEQHVLHDYPTSYLQPYWRMLLGKHLGLKGNVDQLLASGDEKALELKAVIEELLEQAKTEGIINPQGMYRFFPAQSSGNKVFSYDPADHSRVLETFDFPRQQQDGYYCLSDFLRPVESGVMDSVGFLVVTAGAGIHALATKWKEEGNYLRSHALQALALELAEAFSERTHHIMRDAWSISDPANMTMLERFGARYQGIRVSFGYPACPNLEDQTQLFRYEPGKHRRRADRRLHDGPGSECLRDGVFSSASAVFQRVNWSSVHKNSLLATCGC